MLAAFALAARVWAGERADAASELALDFTRAFDRAPIASSNYGWAFTVTAPITVDGLGLWDAGSDGLIEKHEVGLWSENFEAPGPVLIASEDVSNNDSAPVPSMFSGGQWVFSTIAPLTLQPGSYIIGATYRAGSPGAYDPFVSDALPVFTAPGVDYGSTREIHNTPTLTCPTDFGLNEHNGFFGPNFRVVPEPSAATLAGAGLLFASSRRRRAREL